MKKLLPALLLLFTASNVLAQQEEKIITDRPDQTEAPTTVSPGVLQVESGLIFRTEDNISVLPKEAGSFRRQTYALPRSLFRLGLFNNFELRLRTQITGYRIAGNQDLRYRTWGMDDLWLGFKLQLTEDNGSGPTVGFFSHLILPTGTDGISREGTGITSKVAVAHELSDKHEVSWNIGYEYMGRGSGDLYYSLVWEVALADFLEIYIEPYGSLHELETWEGNADAGLKYYISNNMMLDYAFGLGINEEMNFHTLGFSFRLPK